MVGAYPPAAPPPPRNFASFFKKPSDIEMNNDSLIKQVKFLNGTPTLEYEDDEFEKLVAPHRLCLVGKFLYGCPKMEEKDGGKKLDDPATKKKGLKIANPKPKWLFKGGEEKSTTPKVNVQILNENPLIAKATETNSVLSINPAEKTLGEHAIESYPLRGKPWKRAHVSHAPKTGTLDMQLMVSTSGLTDKEKETILVDVPDVSVSHNLHLEFGNIVQIEVVQPVIVLVKTNSSNRFFALLEGGDHDMINDSDDEENVYRERNVDEQLVQASDSIEVALRNMAPSPKLGMGKFPDNS
ncbi:OLC1v1016195C1 [Oldenlandia corymbosa var. corymbosa]|uniref:OLC1v1016195C1 n=1 Tax=Oldenlandia corymbosa var. corymbosa TaxID=529605 RepID=A0AAV1E6Q9_OLDCO|nr:OLC1v1016195C1 [Oldenlandia corymbosa var. corymbosa]